MTMSAFIIPTHFPSWSFQVLVTVLLCNQATFATAQLNLNHFTSLPKCQGATHLGEQVHIPRPFFSNSDLKNVSDEEQILVKLVAQNHAPCNSEERVSSLNVTAELASLTQVLTLFRSGYLLHDKAYYDQEEYCLQDVFLDEDNNKEISLSVKICEPRCSSKSTACVHKCCEPGKVWDLKDYVSKKVLSCEPSGHKQWKPVLYHEDNYHDKLAKMGLNAENVNIRFGAAHPRHFCDDGGFFLMTLKDYNGMEASPFRILNNGKAVIKLGRNYWDEVPLGQYCVDGAMNFLDEDEEGDSAASTTTSGNVTDQFSGNEIDTVMLVCTSFLEDPEFEYAGGANLLYVVAMLVASVFLFLTALVYALLWNRQSVHGWTFLGYVVSLLLTFVFLSTAHLSSGEYDCTLVGIACHFFFISCFSWLTALNFDVFWTFKSLNPYPGRAKEILRFCCYAAFAVGVPATIVSVGLILGAIYGDDPESDVIVPKYGVTRCTMDRSADLPYLFGPISVLLGCNLILFPSTLYLVYKSQKVAKLSGMKSSMLKHKIRFFGKLFMLAGITWVFEVISWACTDPTKPVHWIWKFLDLVNILQAVAIFVVFVCNRKTLQELVEKFPRLKRIETILEKATGGVTAAGDRASARKQSSHTVTHVSSVFDVPGLDTVELR